MNRLLAELERLYFLPGQRGLYAPAILAGERVGALPLIGDDAQVRTLTIEFSRGGDWPQVAALYQALQSELQLPAPALAIGGAAAYAIWVSLAAPVPVAHAGHFLAALRSRYLADLPAAAVVLRPCGNKSAADDASSLPLLPAPQPENGAWSAFIDPSLGGMFGDEPWLEMAPNLDKQGELLAQLASVTGDEWERAISLLAASDSADEGRGAAGGELDAGATSARSPAARLPSPPRTLGLGGGFTDPASFLLALMNDPSARARDRIAAAKALLPYSVKRSE